MANINLLPDDFRQREQKEIRKASRFSKESGVEFSSGQKSKATGADQDKPSFWTRLFGTSGSKPKAPSRHVASAQNTETAVTHESKPPLPHLVHAKSQTVYQPRTTRWADILGTGVVKPVASSVHTLKGGGHKFEAVHQPVVERKQTLEAPKSGHTKNSRVAGSGMGWWQIVRSIFIPDHKKEPETLHTPVRLHEDQKPHQAKNHQDSKPEKKDKGLHDAPKTSRLLVDVNLIPQELLLKKNWSPKMQIIFAVLAVVLPALVIAGVYLGMAQLQGATDRDIAFERQRMDQITTAVAALHKRQATDRHLERKLVAINELMKHHIRWTSFFNQLEKYTLDGVYYTDLKADISGELVLPAVAPNYEVAAQQLVALREASDFVSDAQVNAMQVLTDSKKGVVGVSFNLKIVLKDDLLLAK